MELRPGYKQTEVGVIPEEWAVVRFSDLLDLRNGVNADKGAYGKGTPFINVLEVITHSHICAADIPGKVSLPKGAVDSYSVRRGDLVFNRTSETQGEVGLGAVYLDDAEVVFGGFVIRGRPKTDSLDGSYSGYAFRATPIRSQVIAMGQGAIRANIGQVDLRQVLAPRPPLREQRAIAAALGDVDALLGALTQIITKKRDLKQAAMQQLLTGHTRLPSFSGEWDVRPIGSFSAFVTKGATPTTYGFHWENSGFLFLRSECVSEDGLDLAQSMFVSEAAHAALIRGEVRSGDILITITGNVGRVVHLKPDFGIANINQHIARIRVKDPAVVPDFLCHWLSQPRVRAYYTSVTTGQAYPQISLRQVRDTQVPLPARSEQTAIADILSEMDAELAGLEQRLVKTRALKQGMMQELLTGTTRLV